MVASCALSNDPKEGSIDQESLNLAAIKFNIEGILDFGTVVFGENPTTLLEPKDFHGYEFDGKAGGVITITMNSTKCSNPDSVLDLFGPEDANGNRANLAENDDAFIAPCNTDSQIKNFRLPVDGTYLIIAGSFLQQGSTNGGHYKLLMNCNNGACVPDGTLTFAGTRISQTDIFNGVFTPEDLFEIGDFTFESVFRLQDGMGNAVAGLPGGNSPRPNFRQIPNNVHFKAFGAPEAQSCVTCHNVGGDDGAGDNNHNIFQIGDGVNRNSGVPRNPPTVLGNGLRQRVGEEMSSDLTNQLRAGKAQAASSHADVTVNLNSKGIGFGSVIAKADGLNVDSTGIRGVDAPTAPNFDTIVVRPFGWKGREALLRKFVEGGFRVHFGLQSDAQVGFQGGTFGNCAVANPNLLGTGTDCEDPDNDGVKHEVNEGQMTAMATYMGLRETPVRIPAANSTAQTRVNQGEQLFTQIGCASCHTAKMTMKSPIHIEPGDFTPGGFRINLAVDNHDPKPAPNADGSLTIEVFSDFKRHDVGTALQDNQPFNQIGANQFITTPLWGIRDSAPYLHDGRAATLRDAALAHAGFAENAAGVAFSQLSADNQAKITEFLNSLGRVEDLP